MLGASTDHLHFDQGIEPNAPTIGMAPLVDIVLLLICFYLLVMQSIQSHHDDSVQLPAVRTEAAVEMIPAELTVNLSSTGNITVNSKVVSLGQLGEVIGDEQLKAVESGRGLRVVVRADRRQKYGNLNDILKAAREAGVSSVLLRVVERP